MEKDYYKPTLCGIGFLGEGIYKPYINRKKQKVYQVWQDMIIRCYDEKIILKNPTYNQCSVCNEWKNFQNFAKWFFDNYIEGYCLDKDILFKKNKIYSPETCCFVPNEVNVLFTKNDKYRGELPIGVSKVGNKFKASVSKENKRISLGLFENDVLAFLAYKREKEIIIKYMAYKWKDKIPLNIYKALFHYRVEITD